MTPKNPALQKRAQERLRKPDHLPGVCFCFRIFITESLYNVDFVSQMP